MKAKSAHICIFTNVAPSAAGGYDIDALPAAERNLYQAASDAGFQAFQNGYEGTTLSMCNAKAADFQKFLSTVSETPPFAAIVATYPDGSQKFYLTKSPAKVKNLLFSLWSGNFGGSGTPGDLSGEGSGGGYGSGSNILCDLFPPLCSLGFWPWLAITAFVTYRTFEARSIVGRGLWGAAAFFTWKEFAARGGLQQLQAGIGELKVGNKQWYEIRDAFERNMRSNPIFPNLRFDKEDLKDPKIPKGRFYQDGLTNQLFHAYLAGFGLGEYYCQ